MKKIIALVVLLVILTGCSGNLNIVIKEDKSLNEEIIINDSVILNENEKEDYINELISLNGYDSSYLLNKIIENDYVGVELSKNYNNTDLCSSLRNTSLKKIMYNFSCSKEDDRYIIRGTANYFVCDENCFEPPEVSSGIVNITLPNKAKKHNADEVNGNTYTWHFDGSKDQNLELEFKINGVISENTKTNIELAKTVAILVLGFISVGILGFIVLYNKYKNNKLEY